MTFDIEILRRRVGTSEYDCPTAQELWSCGALVQIYGGVDCRLSVDALWGLDGHLWGNLRGGIINIGALATGVVWESSQERRRQVEKIRRDIARRSVEKLEPHNRANFARYFGYTLEQLDLEYNQVSML